MSLSQQLQILRGKIPVILGIITDEREEKKTFPFAHKAGFTVQFLNGNSH